MIAVACEPSVFTAVSHRVQAGVGVNYVPLYAGSNNTYAL